MNELPRHRASEPAAAAEIERDLEHPSIRVSAAQSQALARLRCQRHVERICRVPRLVFELLDEIGRHHGIEADVADRLERYAALDRRLLAAVGGDRFPTTPVRLVGGAR